ncbi:MAG TPA: DUF4097 family beta strand repeat-containing protein [Rudaea sp.]|nr:DUF4097 family beta strand repeat-containing protein [Rudaea sp.]
MAERGRLLWLLLSAIAVLPACVLGAEPAPPQSTTIVADKSSQTLSQAWRIDNDAMIEVHNVRGNVEISAGETGRATLEGSLGAGSRLVVDGDAKRLELRVEAADQEHAWFGTHGPRSDSNLALKVPSGASVKLELVSADGSVTGIDGKSLNVDCVSGKLTLSSGAAQVDVENVSGDVTMSATHADANSRTHLQTVSGDIELTGAGGRVKLETVSGRARMSGAEVQEFEAGSVSGNIEMTATRLGKHARVQADTMSGDIRAELPADVSARIEAESFSGRIRSDFGKVEKPEYGPGSNLDAHVGDGDAQITVKSFSGNVDILRKP